MRHLQKEKTTPNDCSSKIDFSVFDEQVDLEKLKWKVSRAKKKYEVYLITHVFDCENDPNCEIWHRDFAGETYAVSPEQAANQVRYRNGEKSGCYQDKYCEQWYEAKEVIQ